MKKKIILIIFLVTGLFLLLIGLLLVSNKEIGFFFINFISNLRNISPYYLLNNSFPIYISWLKEIYIAGIYLASFAFLILLISVIFAIKFRYSNLFFLIFVFFFTLIISYFFNIIGADPHHDGVMLKPAIDIVEGKLLFKESFTQYGALTAYLQSLSVLIFGKHLIAIRLLTTFFYSGISILLYLIFSRLLNKFLNIFLCIIWILLAPFYLAISLPWSSVYALFFQLLSFYLIIIFIEKKKFIFICLSGIATSLTFWCRQPVGVFLFIAVLIFLIFLKFIFKKNVKFLLKSISLFLVGFIGMSLIFLLCFLALNSLKDWWLQSIIFSFYWNSKRMSLYGSFGFLFRCLFIIDYEQSFIWRVFPVINLILLAKYLFKFLKKRALNRKEVIIFSIVFLSLASWLQYYPGPGFAHAYWAATPMVGLSVYFIWESIRVIITFFFNKTKRKKMIMKHKLRNIIGVCEKPKLACSIKLIITLLILALIFSYDITLRVKNGLNRLENNQIEINCPRTFLGSKFNKEDAIKYYKLGKVISNLNENFEDKNIITTGEDALFLTFQEDNTSFSPMFVDWGEFNLFLYPDYKEKLNNYIIEEKPIIIMLRGQFYPDYFEIYSWDNYFISIPLELKDKYFSLFENKSLSDSEELNSEQIDSLNDSLKQQIDLYGFNKLTFSSLFFDNTLKLIPVSSESNLWLDPLIKNKIPASKVVFNLINSKELKTKLIYCKEEEFIRFLCYFLLEREPDEDSLKEWASSLKKGLTRDEALRSFLKSDEWKNKCMEYSLVP